MDKDIQSDLYRYSQKTSFSGLLGSMRTPGFKFTFFFRKLKVTKKYTPLWFLYKFFYTRYFVKYGFQIPSSAVIGKGLYMPHFGNIIINNATIIGENCTIAHSITIGKTDRGARKGVPKIGNFVWIGTGSVLVGNITIGDNVLIAPNSFINFDIPSNSLFVAGKIIPKSDATDGYINNILY